MGLLPDDFQKRVQLYQKSGLESSLGKFTNTTAQTNALKSYVSGGSTSGSTGGDLNSIIDASIKRLQDLNKPAITSLQASIPETQAKFDTQNTYLKGQATNLEDRYNSLLEQIKGKEQVATNRQTVSTQNELAKRGIMTDSGVGQQALTDALNPITSEYAGMTKDTGLAREADLLNLNNQINTNTASGVDAVRAINNAIAQLQSGVGTNAVNQALNQYQILQSKDQFNQNLALQKAAQALAEKQYNEVTLPTTQYNLNKPYYQTDPNQATIQSLLNKLIQNISGSGSSSAWEVVNG